MLGEGERQERTESASEEHDHQGSNLLDVTTESDEGGGNEETNLLRENPQVGKPRGLIYQTVSKGSRCETFFRAGLCHPEHMKG